MEFMLNRSCGTKIREVMFFGLGVARNSMSACRPPTLLGKSEVENGAFGARGPDGFYDSPEFEGSKIRYCGEV